MNATLAPSELITRLMDGYLATQMLYVAARLGLADALGDGSRTSAELAADVGAAPEPLHRLLRGLVLEGVLLEEPGGRYALTDAGRLLRAGSPGSIRGSVLARGGLYYRAAGGLLETVRGGGTAFRHVYGVELFEHLASSPDDAAAFQHSMTARSRREADAIATTYDFTPFEHVVDIGGGSGVTLAAILNAYPNVRGTLFDRPDVAVNARTQLAAAGLTGRATVVGGDFFEGVPRGGDVYVLSRVLHDWDDERAVRILKACRDAMTDRGRVVIADAIIGDRVHDQPAAVRMDLHMLTLTSGRERTAAEFANVLRAAGFHLARILAPSGSPGIQIVEAMPGVTPEL